MYQSSDTADLHSDPEHGKGGRGLPLLRQARQPVHFVEQKARVLVGVGVVHTHDLALVLVELDRRSGTVAVGSRYSSPSMSIRPERVRRLE